VLDFFNRTGGTVADDVGVGLPFGSFDTLPGPFRGVGVGLLLGSELTWPGPFRGVGVGLLLGSELTWPGPFRGLEAGDAKGLRPFLTRHSPSTPSP
jgi:hypothetical protein